MSTPTTAPLSALSIDPFNVRRTDVEPAESFIANIEAEGIRQPLLARPNGEGFKVYEGGKRVRSLIALRDRHAFIQGVEVTDEYLVPVIVTELTDEQARDASLGMNIHRDDMHPVDKFEAFAEAVAGGADADDIAKRHGIGKREVKQILALGALSPKIREAWRAGDLDEDGARAYTMAADHSDQERVFKKVGKRSNSWQIRRAITGDQENVATFLHFVGRKDYEAAGGAVIEDLFAEKGCDESAVSDQKLLRKLAEDKIAAKCAELTADGWSWAETREQVGHNTYSWNQLPGGKKQSPENKAKSGCIVELKHDGTLDIRYAMQKPAQAKSAAAAKAKKKAGKEGAAAEPEASTISNALAHRLSCTLTTAAAKAIEGEPALALAIAVAALLSYEDGVKLDNNGMGAHELEQDGEFPDVLARVAKKTPKEHLAMLAKIVGASFDFQNHNASRDHFDEEDGASTICDAIDAKRMNAALRELFDPKDYFGGISKALIAQAVTEAMGKEHAAKVLKMKTKEAAEFAIANVPPKKWLPPQLRVAGYDGPGAKAKKPAKKAAKKKAA